MEGQMKTITEIAKSYEERSTWDRFQNGSSQSQRFSNDNATTKSKALWYTTNSEYGRFQGIRKSADASDRGMGGSGDMANGEAGDRRGSQAGSAGGKMSNTGNRSGNESRKSTAGVRLPPITESRKSGRASKAEPEAEPEPEKRPPTMRVLSPSLGIPPPPARKRLTTGVAKQFMTTSCNRLWENMQTVADGAGLDLRTRGGTRQSQADVLTVDNEQDLEIQDDDACSHSVPSLDGSPPPSPRDGRK